MLQRHNIKPMINCITTKQQIGSGSNVSNSHTGGAHVESRPSPWLFSIYFTTFTNSNYIASNELSWKMNWKGRGRKRERSNLIHYTGISLEVLSKNQKDLSTNNCSPSRDSNWAPPNALSWLRVFLSLSRQIQGEHLIRLRPLPSKSFSIHYSVIRRHGSEPFLRSRQLCSYSRTSQHFMEPEDSLPCSQEASTGLYPEPYQSNPYHPIISL
jgi:hypothetical protein